MNTECNDCEYRACRTKYGKLGSCKEPAMKAEMKKLNVCLVISICTTVAIFIAAMIVV